MSPWLHSWPGACQHFQAWAPHLHYLPCGCSWLAHQASAGIACWLLDLCVPSAALLSLAFQALRATFGNDLLQLSHVLVDVLWAPCVADLRAPVLDSVFATDASDCKVAAVQTQLSLKVA